MAGVPVGTHVAEQEVASQPGAPAAAPTVARDAGAPAATAETKMPAPAPEAGGEQGQQQVAVQESINRLPTKPKELRPEDEVPARKYAMAPVKIKGSISETLLWSRENSGSFRSSSFGNMQTAEINASTYVLQSWIAEVKGGIGLIHAKASTNSSQGSNNSFTGNGLLSLFNRSRFPFTMSYRASDSRTSGEFADRSKDKQFSLTQGYRPLFGAAKYKLIYSYDSSDREFLPKNVATLWRGNYDERLGIESSVSAVATINERSAGGQMPVSTRELRARHTYLPEESLLSVYNEAAIQESVTSGVRARYLNARSGFSWQPEDEDLNMFVTGGGQIFASRTVLPQGTAVSARTLSGNLGMNYLVSSRLTLGLAGTISHALSARKSVLTTQQRGFASYKGVGSKFRGASYNWSTNANISNTTSSAAGSRQTATASVSHSLSMPYSFSMFGRQDRLGLSVAQGLSSSVGSGVGWSTTLNNGGTVSWALGQRKALPGASYDTKVQSGGESTFSTRVVLSGSDVRVMGKDPKHYRGYALTLDMNGQGAYSISGYGAKVSLRAGVVRQQDGRLAADVSGNGSYRKVRPFGVRGLVYGANFDINTRLTDVSQNLAGNANAQRLGYSLDQRLTYRIGDNEVRLNGYLARREGQNTSQVFLTLRAWRNFSN